MTRRQCNAEPVFGGIIIKSFKYLISGSMGNGIGELWRNREPTKTRDRGSGFDWAAEEERRDSYSYIVLIAI